MKTCKALMIFVLKCSIVLNTLIHFNLNIMKK